MDSSGGPLEWQIESCMRDWGMATTEGAPTEYRGMAVQWFQMVQTCTYYATAWKIPYVVGESTGIILFISTPESSRVYAENMTCIEQGQVITKPFWFFSQYTNTTIWPS